MKNNTIKSSENPHELINGKWVFKLSKKNIFYLPHNNQPLQNEMVVRLSLNIPEPSPTFSRQQIIDYHTQKNTDFINKIKSQFTNLLTTDISKIHSEVWLVFKEYEEQIIDMLTKLSEVNHLYIYNGDEHIQINQHIFSQENSENNLYSKSEDEINQLLEAKIGETISVTKYMSIEKINRIDVSHSIYNEKYKTLTVDLNMFSKESEIEQIFAYIYSKSENWEQLLERLINNLFFTIKNHYSNKEISIINFDTSGEISGSNTINRTIQISAFPLQNIKTKIEQENYLNSKYHFVDGFISTQLIKNAINNAITFNKHLFEAILKDQFILNELPLINPKFITLEEIKKLNNKTLFVKFSKFNTQSKMNLLFGYLAIEPFNKDVWTNRLQELIIEGLKINNLGKVSDYNFITFDTNNEKDIYQASIGGINNNFKTIEFEDDKLIQLFPDFSSLENIEEGIVQNINANRNMYLNYNKKHSILFDYQTSIVEKRDIKSNIIRESYIQKWETLVSQLKLENTNFNLAKDELEITINKLKDPNEYLTLLALLSIDISEELQTKIFNKFKEIVSSGLESINKKITDLKVIKFKHSDNNRFINEFKLGGYSNKGISYDEINPNSILDNTNKFLNLESISNAIKYFVYSNMTAINKYAVYIGLMSSALSKKTFFKQYKTANLDYFFKNKQHNKFNESKDNLIGILEAVGGVLDYNNQTTYKNKMIVNKESGKISEHADLVSMIACSSLEGVDETSTVISTGFGLLSNGWTAFKSLEWLIENGAKIINCSWGFKVKNKSDAVFFEYSNLAYRLDYIVRKFGIVITKASGNEHRFKPYFRADDLAFNIINVGSTSANGSKLSDFSDYEKNPDYHLTSESPKPLLVAPGELYKYKNSFKDGTSFATPLVSGIISLLMKEFSELEENPAGIMSVLTASSNDIYKNKLNSNGLRYSTGAGLVDYYTARQAAKNLHNFEFYLTQDTSKPLYTSNNITLDSNQELTIAVSSLFNGGYVNLMPGPDLASLDDGISKTPIIGPIVSFISYLYNKKQQSNFANLFDENSKNLLKMSNVINYNNFDSSLIPTILSVKLEKYNPIPETWTEVDFIQNATSNYSNIKKYTYKNYDGTNTFRFKVEILNKPKQIGKDFTANKLSSSFVIRNI